MSESLTDAIKKEISIVNYAEMIGLHTVKHGGRGYHSLKEHDSVVITPDGGFYWWNSNNSKGSIIDFAMDFQNLSRDEAISSLRRLLIDKGVNLENRVNVTEIQKKQSEFKPPKAEKGAWKPLYAYLHKRGIDREVIDYCVKNKLIYQDERRNLCFNGLDYNNDVKYVSYKSTASGNAFRGVAEGSNCDLRFSINLTSKDKKELFICEAGVDVLSVMTLLKMQGQDFRDYAFLSLDTAAHTEALKVHLSHNKQLEKVYLCQDNDIAGQNSALECKTILNDKELYKGKTVWMIPQFAENAQGKDYNDYLQMKLQEEEEICVQL